MIPNSYHFQSRSFLFLADEKHSAHFFLINPDGLTTLRMPVIPTIRLLFEIWTNAPFLLHIIEANAAFLWCRIYRVYDFRVGNNVLVTSQLVFTSRELVKKKAARVGEWLATFTLFPLSPV